ncbi:MAG: tyrosine-type recombinase/integrase [Chitinophagaceae bacterium]
MSKKTFCSVNAIHFTAFLQLKRSLGYKYIMEETTLLTFDLFLLLQDQSCTALSRETVEAWCAKRNHESDITRYGRMICLIQFLYYLSDCGFKVPIPPLPKYPKSTFIPYIYSYDEIAAIFYGCDQVTLACKNMYSSLFVMPCLLRMLYATGIRIGEALSLKNENVNLIEKHLTLKATKNTKDRLVPFTDTLAAVCTDYQQHRNALPVSGIDDPGRPFFVSLIGDPCKNGNIERWFRKVLIKAKIQFNSKGNGPRLHDIRHSFSCHSFTKLANDGMDLYFSWPYLSTYLGHQSLRATEQYIRLTEQLHPELVKDAERMYMDILPNMINNPTQPS